MREIQQALIDLGHPLPWFRADGRYGNETYGVVLGYKRQCNIRTATGYLDGVVGPKTILSLDCALAARFPAPPLPRPPHCAPCPSCPSPLPPDPGPKPPDPGPKPPDPGPKPPVTVATRRNAWELETPTVWDPITLAYARAIQAMIARPPSDPTSWFYQSAIHGTHVTPADPNWNQCQHVTWFFLPWHRMFLHFFERIVRATVIQQGGPTDWALPYWNYSDNPRHAALPPAFRAVTLPDGSPNPLRVEQRAAGFNTGAPLDLSVTRTDFALAATGFSTPSEASFGGGRTPWQHQAQDGPRGALEQLPHDAVHGALGNPNGFMRDPDQAALDPIFWLHHANIDRLWGTWLRLGGGRQNPSDPEWLNQRFSFFDEGGRRVEMAVGDVLDTARLCYRYDDDPAGASESSETEAAARRKERRTPAPLPGRRPAPAARPSPARPRRQPRPRPPRRILSSGPGIHLGGRKALVTHRLGASAKQVVSSVVTAPSRAPRMILRLEGVAFDKHPGVLYQVYLNPQAAPGRVHHQTPHFVGILSFFSRGGRPGPRGFTHSFDITDAVRDLRLQGRWDENLVSVAFVPITGVVHKPGSPAAAKPLPKVPVQVSSIKIHSA